MPSCSNLDIVKLAIDALTPILVLILGIRVNTSLKKSERSTDLRSEIYKTIGVDLNDIYCYLSFVGGWKELTPIDVITRKRSVDRAIFTYRPFFSEELFTTYQKFMHESFKPFGGPGTDACIRSDVESPKGDRRSHGLKTWDPAWENRFTKEQNHKAQEEAYAKFLKQLARDLKI
ncbi:hypothetical protein W02_08970 [Nitrospira sp. KM1]|uniref:hypothetical protein n=1 Tax=Nitrospira sp. KM1 TaxID=1936990 RepID=UPI0013A78D38|nr:hypothetical protein [Nitrospira sp. KM1]BCA53757.1 hypothetical protein W02_08970 [Nitrospira sp. KM1]